MSDLPFPSGDDHAELMREAWSGDEVAALREKADLWDAAVAFEYGASERGETPIAAMHQQLAALRAELERERELRYLAVQQREVECKELEAKLDAVRPIVEAACAASDADLSVYDDVPGANRLMDRLDKAVDEYRANQEAGNE